MEAVLSGFGRHFEAQVSEAEALQVIRALGGQSRLPAEGQDVAVVVAVDEVLWLMHRGGGLVLASNSTPTWKWSTTFHESLLAYSSAGALRVTVEQREAFVRLVAEIFEIEATRVQTAAIEAAVPDVRPGGNRLEAIDIKRAAFAYGEARGLAKRPYAGPERRARPR